MQVAEGEQLHGPQSATGWRPRPRRAWSGCRPGAGSRARRASSARMSCISMISSRVMWSAQPPGSARRISRPAPLSALRHAREGVGSGDLVELLAGWPRCRASSRSARRAATGSPASPRSGSGRGARARSARRSPAPPRCGAARRSTASGSGPDGRCHRGDRRPRRSPSCRPCRRRARSRRRRGRPAAGRSGTTAGKSVHDRVGRMGAGLLDDDDRLIDAARLGDVLGGLRLEARADQVSQLRHPGVAVAVGEEVVALLALEVGERAELGRVLGRRPGQRDRAPDAEVVADVGVVDRDPARARRASAAARCCRFATNRRSRPTAPVPLPRSRV